MFSFIKKKITIKLKKKLFLITYSRLIKKLNSRYFFYNWNQHAEYRASSNLSKSYLLIKNLWYFQKKKFLLIPYNFKKIHTSILNEITYIKLKSKLSDFIKKIF